MVSQQREARMLPLTIMLMILALAIALRPRRYLHFEPRHRQLQTTLDTPERILDLAGVVVCGHPDRHVVLATLPNGSTAYLKREHRVRWQDRLANCWHGFGPVSKSEREAAILINLGKQGIDGPEVIAFGEDGRGRAFLLLRTLEGAVDLRSQARSLHDAPERRRCAERLGTAIARVHLAGIVHGDLYAKHVLVDDHDTIVAIDWQRSRFARRIESTWRDLAALDATMPEESATHRDRLRVLHAYVQTINEEMNCRVDWRTILRDVQKQKQGLLKRRHIQEQCRAPLGRTRQNLIWLDGEALCVTPEFLASLERTRDEESMRFLPGPHAPCLWRPKTEKSHDPIPANVSDKLPVWLTHVARHAPSYPQESVVELPSGSLAMLKSRQARRPWFLFAWLRGRALQTRDLAMAALIFRLERHGVPVPKLLAVGQRCLNPWRWSSFHLTELFDQRTPLPAWLADSTRDCSERRAMLRKVGVLLRRLHDARCHFTTRTSIARAVTVAQSGMSLRLVLSDLESVRTARHECGVTRRRDLLRMSREIAALGGSRTDVLRFLHGYVQRDPLRGREDLPMLLFAASLLQGRLAA